MFEKLGQSSSPASLQPKHPNTEYAKDWGKFDEWIDWARRTPVTASADEIRSLRVDFLQRYAVEPIGDHQVKFRVPKSLIELIEDGQKFVRIAHGHDALTEEMLNFLQERDSKRTPLNGELFHLDGNFPRTKGLTPVEQKKLILLENGHQIQHSIQVAGGHVAFLIATEKCLFQNNDVRTLQDTMVFGADGLMFCMFAREASSDSLAAAALLSVGNSERWDPPVYRLPPRWPFMDF